jgi:uncharacterized protein
MPVSCCANAASHEKGAASPVLEKEAAPVLRLSVGQGVVLAVIRGYKLLFSQQYAGSCRFLPTCSEYAAEAVSRHGVIRGGGLALRRLARCHPFGSSGLDPVPPAPSRKASARPVGL